MNQQNSKPSLESLISKLSDDPENVPSRKKLSVRMAIVGLRDEVGRKVFNKHQLAELIEAKHPELAPVNKSNLDVSISRAGEFIECVETGEFNIYRFKQL